MLINLSNHPLSKWSAEQKSAAQSVYGEIVDMTFPKMDTKAPLADVIIIAEDYMRKCTDKFTEHKKNQSSIDAIHVMGEMTFVYQFVQKMSEQGVTCVASTSERIIEELPDGTINKKFEFVQFRPYTSELF